MLARLHQRIVDKHEPGHDGALGVVAPDYCDICAPRHGATLWPQAFGVHTGDDPLEPVRGAPPEVALVGRLTLR